MNEFENPYPATIDCKDCGEQIVNPQHKAWHEGFLAALERTKKVLNDAAAMCQTKRVSKRS